MDNALVVFRVIRRIFPVDKRNGMPQTGLTVAISSGKSPWQSFLNKILSIPCRS